MKTIKLTQGEVALVDDEDYEYLNQFKWHLHKSYPQKYAARKFNIEGKYVRSFMHNLLIGQKGIDHKDRNGLNNQKENLRKATTLQNHVNRKLKNKTGYTGVHPIKKSPGRYWAYIKENGRALWLGAYSSAEDAAKVRDKKAYEMYGEFAYLNFPET